MVISFPNWSTCPGWKLNLSTIKSGKTKNNIIEEMYIKFILGQRMNKIFLSRYINLLAKTTQKDINPHQIKTNVLGNWSNKFEILCKLVSCWLFIFSKNSGDAQLKKCCPQLISSPRK